MMFGTHRVVDQLDLTITRGEFVSLLGPSGSGKTTILMLLAGFLQPTAGSICLGGKRIDHLPPHRRDMGVVFQNYALFPHMSVADNVAFPLRMRRVGREEIEQRVTRALDMVQLQHLRDRRPAMLSGGQQQRIALARALVFEPSVVLMDEPLGALDKQLREQMQLDIRDLHRRLGLTIVFVTHDQGEALTMSDRIAVFNRGRIEQIGSPTEIYDRPASRFVAEFIGETNLMAGKVTTTGPDGSLIRLDSGEDMAASAADWPAAGNEALLSVRPENVTVQPVGTARRTERVNIMQAKVADSVYQGDHLRLHLDCGQRRMIARLDRQVADYAVGTQVDVVFQADNCRVIPT
ncbi:ABC transporter ATP-binding protein [uncultured Devosia sp.]|uniref:ABC transporter ATP-binding protein n=1 Tax=uncultured Devosia sp. TaxID=211434 RepID=UPI0026163093|nr:ABC transporter ATP-binding protein [uncultured Devosia sp.]